MPLILLLLKNDLVKKENLLDAAILPLGSINITSIISQLVELLNIKQYT